LRIFEGWIDYISGGSETKGPLGDGANESNISNYYRRMRYPDFYKVSSMFITKFERDFNRGSGNRIDYRFINAFPKSIAAVPVAYGEAQILKVSVSFTYDRYISNYQKINTADSANGNLDTINLIEGQIGDFYTGASDSTRSLPSSGIPNSNIFLNA
jgi:hypothetical protein